MPDSPTVIHSTHINHQTYGFCEVEIYSDGSVHMNCCDDTLSWYGSSFDYEDLDGLIQSTEDFAQ